MLGIDIIEKKLERIDPRTGAKMIDLVPAEWDPRRVRFTLRSIALVTEETEMRADLVALLYMKSQASLGTMLKINNISNPLSLERGEILAIPGDQTVTDLSNSGRIKENNKSKTFRKELQDKISKISNDRLEYLNSKNISNAAQALPPNILADGEQQIQIGDGKLIFGPDIGQCRTKSNRNVSLTQLKSKLAQKNIFR